MTFVAIGALRVNSLRLLSSADNVCKQFGLRSEQTKNAGPDLNL